jgi:2,4-dienoyl-CoA reductase-like NADH-dependent reductase (Old Yellow Enzyme family)
VPSLPSSPFTTRLSLHSPQGSLVIAQLTHGGRQVSEEVDPNPVSASDVHLGPTFGMTFGKPRPLEVEEIATLVKNFGNAARVLAEADADGAQLHAAHGYLISQVRSLT